MTFRSPRALVRGARHRLGVAFHEKVRTIAAAEDERRASSSVGPDTSDHVAAGSDQPAVSLDDVRRIAAAEVGRAISDARARPADTPSIFGPRERLYLGPETVVNDALFNTVSGEIRVERQAFFGHGVAVLTGTHDHRATGLARQQTVPDTGRDVVIGAGAWVGSRATLIGPLEIGAHAVVAAGAVVTADVGRGEIVAGVPARRIGEIVPPPDRPTLDVLTDVGRLFVHEHDEFITPCLVEHGRMLDDDLAMIREPRPGATIVDVGANIGYSTLALATAVGASGTVVAVEPHPANAELLRANLARNGASQVRVVEAAAMPTAGRAVLAEAPLNTGDHRIGAADDTGHATTGEERRRAVGVPATTIDAEVAGLERVEVMLLDTQGTEHRALEGGVATIERHRPVLVVEFWPRGIRSFGDDPHDVLAFYRGLGYDRTVVEDPSLDASGDDATLVTAVDARPGAAGGFATLLLRPSS